MFSATAMFAKSGPKRHHQRGANQLATRNIQRDDQRVTWNDICVWANCSWATKPRPTVTEMLCLADNNQCQLFTRSVCFQTSIYLSIYLSVSLWTSHQNHIKTQVNLCMLKSKSYHAASNILPIHYCNRALSQPSELRTTPAVQHRSWLPKKKYLPTPANQPWTCKVIWYQKYWCHHCPQTNIITIVLAGPQNIRKRKQQWRRNKKISERKTRNVMTPPHTPPTPTPPTPLTPPAIARRVA